MKRSKRATSDDRVDDARKRPRVVATPASADAAAPPPPPPPPTLREWLRRGRFSLALSQGFCAYSAEVGALLGVEQAFDEVDEDDDEGDDEGAPTHTSHDEDEACAPTDAAANTSPRPGRPPRAPRVPRVPFHARLHAVGGSSSGGLVAAAVASGQ